MLCAFAALGNPASRACYDEKIAQGKHHTQALLCLARRRADVLFAMLRDGTFCNRSRRRNKALVFRVEDLDSVTRTFRDLGVTTVWEQMDLGDGSISTAIRDNDGNLINVFQQGASPVGWHGEPISPDAEPDSAAPDVVVQDMVGAADHRLTQVCGGRPANGLCACGQSAVRQAMSRPSGAADSQRRFPAVPAAVLPFTGVRAVANSAPSLTPCELKQVLVEDLGVLGHHREAVRRALVDLVLRVLDDLG